MEVRKRGRQNQVTHHCQLHEKPQMEITLSLQTPALSQADAFWQGVGETLAHSSAWEGEEVLLLPTLFLHLVCHWSELALLWVVICPQG